MIDVHTHIFPKWLEHITDTALRMRHSKSLKTGASAEGLEMQAVSAGVDKCFVFPLPVNAFLKTSNDYIRKIKNDRFVKFGCVLKKEDVPRLKQEGFQGIKIHQYFQKNRISRLKEILDSSEKEEMIVSVHLSEKLFEFDAFSRNVAHLLDNRTNPLIIAHLSAVEALRDSTVFFDTALRTMDSVNAAIKTVGSKRILFGSDFPLVNISEEASKFSSMRLKERRRILHKNASDMLRRL